MLLLAVLLTAAEVLADADTPNPTNKSTKLVEKIRRQLMQDNYDYLPSEDELLTTAHAPYNLDGPNDKLAGSDDDRGLRNDASNDGDSDRLNYVSNDRVTGGNNNRINGGNNNVVYGINNDRVNGGNNDRVSGGNNYKISSDNNDRINEGNNNKVIGGNNNKVDGGNNDKYEPNPGLRYRLNYNDNGNDRAQVADEGDDGDANMMTDNDDDFIPRAKDDQYDEGPDTQKGSHKDHVVSKTDLLYYVDDERLRRRTAGDRDPQPDRTPISSTAKYKIIKVGGSHANRRSGAARRLIQEESAAGVALIRLDAAPFPQFRLPRARRQYSHARASPELDAAAGNRALPPLYDQQDD